MDLWIGVLKLYWRMRWRRRDEVIYEEEDTYKQAGLDMTRG